MTAMRIDTLARRLGRAIDRRSVLRGALGLAGLAVAPVGARAGIVAQPIVCRLPGQACAAHRQCCGLRCPTSGPRPLRYRCSCVGLLRPCEVDADCCRSLSAGSEHVCVMDIYGFRRCERRRIG